MLNFENIYIKEERILKRIHCLEYFKKLKSISKFFLASFSAILTSFLLGCMVLGFYLLLAPKNNLSGIARLILLALFFSACLVLICCSKVIYYEKKELLKEDLYLAPICLFSLFLHILSLIALVVYFAYLSFNLFKSLSIYLNL